MKKAYETPEMNISVFSVEDIITDSGVATSSVKAAGKLKAAGVAESNTFSVTLSAAE